MTHLTYCIPKNCATFSDDLFSILPNEQWVAKKEHAYLNYPAVFDIETSSFYESEEKRCCMYAWVFGINGRCVRGRTWEEFQKVIRAIELVYNLSVERRLIIYVHNLSYEFQFIRKMFEWEKVFALDNRKPVYAITKTGIEFRCSYILSGYSLEKLGENLHKYKVNKAVGDLDYRLIRHSNTPLTPREWGYILNDGLVVMAHIQEEIERLGDISKIPLTNTGYIRQLCRDTCLKNTEGFNYNRLMKTLTVTEDEYYQLKQAYTGGFTHANLNYVNRIIHDVHSFDFTSSYPAVMLAERYPMSKGYHTVIRCADDLEYYLSRYCCMFDVTFYELNSCVDYENYISLSRCQAERYIVNNGRVVEAEKLTTTVTEQDFDIIRRLYTWENMEISNFTCYYKDYLPKPLIQTVLQLYQNKTKLKGVEGKEVEYMVSKGMINSCYGMCVTDPCRDENYYDESWKTEQGDIKEMIKQYNKNKQRFLYYPWGVWVTAYARHNLFSGILEFKNDYIYSDTDSIKVVNIDKHKDYIDQYNHLITSKIENCLHNYKLDTKSASPQTKNGVSKPLGVWDYEGKYDLFKTLGSKRYCTSSNGDFSITVAGVSKKAGKEYLKQKYKDIPSIFEHFTEDLNFPAYYDNNGEICNGSGKLCHTYLDEPMTGEVIDYTGVKGEYKELSGIHMENTEYTMSIEKQFKVLMKGVKQAQLW